MSVARISYGFPNEGNTCFAGTPLMCIMLDPDFTKKYEEIAEKTRDKSKKLHNDNPKKFETERAVSLINQLLCIANTNNNGLLPRFLKTLDSTLSDKKQHTIDSFLGSFRRAIPEDLGLSFPLLTHAKIFTLSPSGASQEIRKISETSSSDSPSLEWIAFSSRDQLKERECKINEMWVERCCYVFDVYGDLIFVNCPRDDWRPLANDVIRLPLWDESDLKELKDDHQKVIKPKKTADYELFAVIMSRRFSEKDGHAWANVRVKGDKWNSYDHGKVTLNGADPYFEASKTEDAASVEKLVLKRIKVETTSLSQYVLELISGT